MTIAKNMTAEQFEKLKAENPDVVERAKVCTALTHAFYESVIEFNMSDAGNKVSDHIAGGGKVIPQFIPVGIVNDHHSITWIEEIVDDQAPIGAILYALQDSVGRNVSFAKEQK